jgi:hypothetical protein
MITGTLAAKGLPRILPARCQEKPGYTGLVLLSFRIREGVETLEQLRSMVNLWSQTLLSFVGSSGSSLKVLIPYQLTGGGLPTDEAQVALFQQYAYKTGGGVCAGLDGHQARRGDTRRHRELPAVVRP